VLTAVGLRPWRRGSNENAHWTQILSGGEQQRLASSRL